MKGGATMSVAELKNPVSSIDVGEKAHNLIADLYPLCRSITGDGVRETLRRLQQYVPLAIHEVPTGTRVLDWTVPKEWNIKDAYIKNMQGERVVDFHRSNLHVVGYSRPVRARLSLDELKHHLFTLPANPDWIPYRASFFKESWGFCLSHNQLLKLKDPEYEVCIDSTMEDGYLTFGEHYLAGETTDEVLISTHVCHPSLCNDNLSGIAIVTLLAERLALESRRYSYRFLFIPATIGSITWLAGNEDNVPNIKHGLVVAGVGDPGNLTYKRSRRGDAEIDRVVAHVMKHAHQDHEILDFCPEGYDERQFCSPGFDLPVGCFMRTAHGRYDEYHSSGDNLDFVRPESLEDSFNKLLDVFHVLENNGAYLSQNPKCEPQLGKRGLYRGYPENGIDETAVLWVLNLSDGNHTLLDIAERSGVSFATIRNAANELLARDLLRES